MTYIETRSRAVLAGYRAYDRLNEGRAEPLIKILVSYIKPSFLFKSDIFVPMHLGRAVEAETSKDGVVAEDDLKWLHENCIGDDDFEGNISRVNRRVGFFTGTYWAWKNYERLGNPEWIGSFGYRKFLSPEFLEDIDSADVWAPCLEDFGFQSLKDQMCAVHGEAAYAAMREALLAVHPEDIGLLDRYMSMPFGAYHELYVMRRGVFFDFCAWIWPMLEFLLARHENFIGVPVEIYKGNNLGICVTLPVKPLLVKFMDRDMLDDYVNENFSPTRQDRRDIAFIMERLTGFYLYKCHCNPGLRVKNCKMNIIAETTLKRVLLETMRRRVRSGGQK